MNRRLLAPVGRGLALSVVLTLALALLSALVGGCHDRADEKAGASSTPTRLSHPPAAGSAPSSPEPRAVSRAAPPSGDPYVDVARLLHAHGVRIWWESDLVARWLEGPASFERAVRRLGALARQPGTAGFKVADEIGYQDGLLTPERATQFLEDTRAALTRVAPGKEILVDAVVLELGCLPRAVEAMDCAKKARHEAPAATIGAITSYLQAGLIDRLDLSTGLLDRAVYPDHDLEEAQDFAWTYVEAGPWPRMARVQSRKALARHGGFVGDAAAAARVYVDVPRRHGTGAADIWTWRQGYQDQMVSLFGDDPTHNPLWPVLVAEHRDGQQLFTHVTPSALPTDRADLARDCALVAQVFSDVFVAAGTG